MAAVTLQTLDAIQPYFTGLHMIFGGESMVAITPLAGLMLVFIILGIRQLFRDTSGKVPGGIQHAFSTHFAGRVHDVHTSIGADLLKPKTEDATPLGPEFFEGLAKRLGVAQEPTDKPRFLNVLELFQKGAQCLEEVQRNGTQTTVMLVELDGWESFNATLLTHHREEALACLSRSISKYVSDMDHLGWIENDRILIILNEDNGPRAEICITQISNDIARHRFPLGSSNIQLGANCVFATLDPEITEFFELKEALLDALMEKNVTWVQSVTN